MILKQYYLGCLAHASYLLGDEASTTAIIVDPQRDIQKYLADAEAFGLQIRHVFLTHFHADFLAGHLELRDQCGATIHLGARGQAEYAFQPMHDGDTLDFPGLRLQVLETPGHTIESISILVFDLQKDATQPHAVLTGDTLFIGDVGRPDLRASLGWTANDLGSHLYDSLHGKLLTLPDETLVYPAHGAGSLCGKSLSADTVSPLGAQRRMNYALQPMSREEFIRLVTADQPDAPPYFTYDAILNTREHATLDRNLQRVLQPVDLNEVLAMGDAGAQILDVRDPAEYAKGHLAGSINIGLGGQYATWAGTVLDRSKPIVIISEPGREQEAALRLGRIGFDHVKGYLGSGMEALAGRPDLVWPTERVSAPVVAEELAGNNPPLLLDVRNPREWAAKHIAGSLNVPLNHLQERLSEIPRDCRIAVHCAGGYRSSIAASILHQNGITLLIEMAGGLAAWEAASLKLAPAVL
ncbi:MBL fold metallo-hydrolase [Paludibaculum fermentans]|uniref:MBL fold metallo-hydrolase n=1 Tax=Paludibaculum fermentans TaxID=1473598 RepID=A0A7S7SLB9_PALFE|nr:MBL fold metallo-hydrolase [Paludibaculum fermentans]QOY87895.1 MBL fold metallo-hydrolase [Paludibaculum fermentans]